MSTTNVISENLPIIADELTGLLEDLAGKPVAFSLFVWTEGEVQYISSTKDRAEVKKSLLAVINGWDEGMPDVPAHKRH